MNAGSVDALHPAKWSLHKRLIAMFDIHTMQNEAEVVYCITSLEMKPGATTSASLPPSFVMLMGEAHIE